MAEILFSDTVIDACTRKVGGDVFSLSAGSRIQIRDNETGEAVDRLNEIVPAGKSWQIEMTIVITETST